MSNIFIFPGQGSQDVGMGKALYDSFAEAKEVFDEVDDTLGQKLSDIIFNGPIETLTETENTQPALMATSIAALRVLLKQSGKSIEDLASYVAGHSLGEYSALCAAGSLSLADTARLLRIRGQAMQQAVPAGQGGMAAIIGVDIATAQNIAEQAAGEEVCEVANDNSDGQVVISGSKSAIERGEAIAKDAGAKRYLPLNVSAPFHCSLIQPAADRMAEALAEVNVSAPAVPLIANVTAAETTDPDAIKQQLVDQVTGRVRWRETIESLAGKGVTGTVEIGSGKVLTGLTRRINKELEAVAVGSPEDIESFLS